MPLLGRRCLDATCIAKFIFRQIFKNKNSAGEMSVIAGTAHCDEKHVMLNMTSPSPLAKRWLRRREGTRCRDLVVHAFAFFGEAIGAMQRGNAAV